MHRVIRSIDIVVPEEVAVSRFIDIRRVIAATLNDDSLPIRVQYPCVEDLSKKLVIGTTRGPFSEQEFEGVVGALFNHLGKQFQVQFVEVEGTLVWNMGLQLA